jgi:hypothetical protein
VSELRMIETVVLVPGCTEEYLEALHRDYLPMTRGHGLDLREVLRSPDESGEEELVLVWDVAGWSAYSQFRSFFQFGHEPAATRWVELAGSLRTGGRRRLMISVVTV